GELKRGEGRGVGGLGELEEEGGRPDEASRLRQAVRAIDQARKDYIQLLASQTPESHAAELARLAERLGRRFDAARWAALDTAAPRPPPARTPASPPPHGPP